MNKEIWKDIPNYEGLYQVSNLGRVVSLCYNNNAYNKMTKRSVPRILKGRLTGKKPNRYLSVALYKEHKVKYFRIHRLVAETFLGKSNLTVNHKDKNVLNNKLDNLEYLTNKDNMRYSRAKKVNQYDLEGNLIKTWNAIIDATKELKINHISQACRGIRNTAGGYIWKFKEE